MSIRIAFARVRDAINFRPLLVPVLRLLFPGLGDAAISLISVVWPMIAEAVAEYETSDLAGRTRARRTFAAIGDYLDEHLDDAGDTWSLLTEEERDRAIKGLVEVSVALHRMAQIGRDDRGLVRAIRVMIERRNG